MKPNCPKCNEELIWDELDVDMTNNGDNLILITVRGTCPKCNKRFIWDETYKYVKRNELTEDD